MSKLKTLTRRAFLITSTAVAGGVAFGTYKYKTDLPNPLLDDLKDGEAAITPFVQIDADGVTLITPRADKGQGAVSLQAHLLAEELDVNLANVRISPGKPDPAYYNGAVMDEGMPGFGKLIGKMVGLQMTGGSSTAPDLFVRLREAGAVARETIKLAASTKYGVDIAELTTDDAKVFMPDGRSVSYASLAVEVAKLKPVQDVILKPESEWRYLGKSLKRLDIVAKSTGTERYGVDLVVDNMVYATVRTNPALGGGVIKFDDARARKMRGIKKIIEIDQGVAVVADNTWRAFQAAQAIDITWGAASYPETSAQMWQELEEHAKPKFQNVQRKSNGDVEHVLSSGDVIESEFRAPHLAHAPLEPSNAIVQVSDERVDVWAGTQIPRVIQDHASKMTGVDKANIHVHAQSIGGSFGRRLEDDYVLQAIEIAMAVKDTPVKMTWSREEDMSHNFPRPMALAKAAGKVSEGRVEAIKLDLISPSLVASWMSRVAVALPGPDAMITIGADDQPFSIPHYQVTGFKAAETVPISYWRSVSASQNGFFHEAFLDELIFQAGADPLEERLRLCTDPVARKVLEEMGEMANWKGRQLGPNRARGMAFVKSFSVPVAEVVDVTLTDQGIRLDDVYVIADVGTVLDPVNIDAQLFGGAIWALSHAINNELTYENHKPVQTNFHDYESMRMYQVPKMHVRATEYGDKVRGAGEVAVPPGAPALANAIFALTGQRLREMPFNKFIDFV